MRIFNCLLILTGLTVFTTTYADIVNVKETRDYIGIDAIYSKMKFKENYGENIFAQSAPGINLFYGHMFTNIVGAEIGYEMKQTKKREETIPEGDMVAGRSTAVGVISESYATNLQQQYPYCGVLFKRNLNNNSASILIGLSLSHVRARYNLFNNGLNVSQDETRTFEKTKLMSIVRASAEHVFDNKLGIRVLATWKRTSKFNIKSQENPSGNSRIMLKNAIQAGLGIFYTID